MSKLEDRSTELHQYHQDLDRYKETIQLTFDVLSKAFEEENIEKSVNHSSIQEPQSVKVDLDDVALDANIEKTIRPRASQHHSQSKRRTVSLKPILIKITVLTLAITLILLLASWSVDLHFLQRK
jgi:hypothetical protein